MPVLCSICARSVNYQTHVSICVMLSCICFRDRIQSFMSAFASSIRLTKLCPFFAKNGVHLDEEVCDVCYHLC